MPGAGLVHAHRRRAAHPRVSCQPAMFAGFMLPPWRQAPEAQGWFIIGCYRLGGTILEEDRPSTGEEEKKRIKCPHALKVQGRKGGGSGGSGLGVRHFPVWLQLSDQAPKDHQPPGLTAALCRPAQERCSPRGVKGW